MNNKIQTNSSKLVSLGLISILAGYTLKNADNLRSAWNERKAMEETETKETKKKDK